MCMLSHPLLARHFSNHVRDVPDDVLIRLAENNGVIMINSYPPFVKESVRNKERKKKWKSLFGEMLFP